jgi:hypothetical protein
MLQRRCLQPLESCELPMQVFRDCASIHCTLIKYEQVSPPRINAAYEEVAAVDAVLQLLPDGADVMGAQLQRPLGCGARRDHLGQHKGQQEQAQPDTSARVPRVM